jgi:hypothetical protein
MEALRALDPAEGMIEHFGDRAATEALVLASNAAMLGDLRHHHVAECGPANSSALGEEISLSLAAQHQGRASS